MEATRGMGNLCLHRMSNRSSIKPSKVAVSSERRDERYNVS
jgi:hypothetical protein